MLIPMVQELARRGRTRYQKVFGEATESRHRQHLIRRIPWRLQVSMAQRTALAVAVGN